MPPKAIVMSGSVMPRAMSGSLLAQVATEGQADVQRSVLQPEAMLIFALEGLVWVCVPTTTRSPVRGLC